MIIRPEEERDHDAVAQVITSAFARADEARLVEALRREPDFIPRLSLVADEGGAVTGHLLFTAAPIVGDARVWPALALAPLSVRPAWQRKGVGSQLMRHGLDECRRLGHQLVVVLGHAAYYPRFGFTSAQAAGIEAPFPVRNESFMALELVPGAFDGVKGTIRYAPPFAAV